MKKLLAVLSITSCVAFATSCSNSTAEETTTTDNMSTTETIETPATTSAYIDPVTGTEVAYDAATGYYVDAAGEPVAFYVNTSSMDTFYGKGVNVNNAIIHNGNDWEVDEAKVKIDGDEIKIKHADGSKTKIEGDEIKVKNADGSKTKMDGDETKIKTGDTKIKSSAEGTKIKED